MFSPFAVISVFCLYIGILFFIALRTERKAAGGINIGDNPVIYSLSLAVYCTTWTYYGSVGLAANSGMLFLTTYLGPTISIVLWWSVLRKMVRIKNVYKVTSIVDIITARYDKSRMLAAMATLFVIVGFVPYIALQFKAMLSTFAMITNTGVEPSVAGSIFVCLMVIFAIIFGARRLDITERHQGMIVALAVECIVKLAAFLSAGIFITYFLFDGLGDILDRVSRVPATELLVTGNTGASYFTWAAYMILSMSAVLFLPRQFHLAVVENFNEDHIRTAMWLFPLYLFLINFFVLPIAMGGLLLGYPVSSADTLVLSLPLHSGQKWLSLFVFIGGLSAATGMIMINSMTVSTMVTNNLLLPVIDWINWLGFLKRYILQTRWICLAAYILTGYWFALTVGESFILVNIGMISFAAALQFAPVILGGLFWRKGGKGGAIMGLCAGFMAWAYTLLLPALEKSGVTGTRFLTEGFLGIKALAPEQLFGVSSLDPFSHAVFWTMFFNIGFYMLGSLYFRQSENEQRTAEGFIGILEPSLPPPALLEKPVSKLSDKQKVLETVLGQYFPEEKASSIVRQCILDTGLYGREDITIGELIRLFDEIERVLAGVIGAAAAQHALRQGEIMTVAEEKELSKAFSEIISEIKSTPAELKGKIEDFHNERQLLFKRQAIELQEKVNDLNKEMARRKEAVEGMRGSEEKYRTLVDNVNIGVYRKTEESFIQVNPAMIKIFGYDSAEDFKKLSMAELYWRPKDRQDFLEEVRRNGFVKEKELAMRKKDGTPIWCSATTSAQYGEDGRMKWMDGVLEDITARKRLEDQLRQSQKMEAIGTLAGGVAHDFNNILTAIMGYGSLMRMRLDKADPLSRYVDDILAAAEKAAHLTRSLLTFGRKQVIDLKPVDLNEIVKRVGKLLVRVIGEDIEFRTMLSGEVLITMADSIQIEQVLMNLATNARDAMPGGGVLSMTTERVEINERGSLITPGSYACISISDTGAGMDEKTRQRIFEPFFTTKEVGKGTGLGLSIVYGIIKQHNGEINVYSEPGSGTTFKIYLKLSESSVPRMEAPSPAVSAGGSETIMIAEDDREVRRMIKTVLEEFGYAVIEATDGDEALEKFAENRDKLQLLILDVVMPRKNGREVFEEIRKLRKDIRVLFLSGYTAEIIHKKGIIEEGVNFISKPVAPRLLLTKVREVLSE